MVNGDLKNKSKARIPTVFKNFYFSRGIKADLCICGIFCEIERLKVDVTVIIIL